MLDEIDKFGAGIQGDPAAALLEVLDPGQNNTFRDISRRAVRLQRRGVDHHGHARDRSRPLRDRMEIITLAGYTAEEKVEIAQRYLLRRQLEETA